MKVVDMANMIDVEEEEVKKCFDERAWVANEEKNSLELMKTTDLGACALDCRKLKLIKSIARGGYACVYQGIYHNKKVAVKVFHMADKTRSTKLRRSFLQEVSLLKNLHHLNIIKFIGGMENMLGVNINVKNNQDFDTTQDCCLVTEFLPKGTLCQYLKLKKDYKKNLPISIVVQIALDIAQGLSFLHSKKIMHRDVKTDNMLMDKNGRVKIIDFGSSGFEDSAEHTQTIGTLGYMAPEVYDGDSYDHKCDVYSYGICLCEIYCCSFPYVMTQLYERLRDYPDFRDSYKNMRPEIPRSCPSGLADVINQCLDADPKKRPEMTSVVQMLQKFEESTMYHCAKAPSWLSCVG